VDIPLKGALEVAGSSWSLGTFGVTLVLRKVSHNELCSAAPRFDGSLLIHRSTFFKIKDGTLNDM
jgi:uncharacterized membrane protein